MQRNKALDITKGIGILLVIIGHCGSIPYMPIRHFIFTFHMPLFFLVSGYLYKAKNAKEALKKDIRRFGLPYAITCITIVLFYLLCYFFTKSHNAEPLKRYLFASIWGSGTYHPCKYLSNLPAIGAIWFFPALIACKNVYNILPEKYRLLVSSIIFLVATIVGRYVIFIPFSVLCGLSAIIFYAVGDYLKKMKELPFPYWVIGILCWYISFMYSHISIAQPRLDLYYVDVIGATTATIIVYLLSIRITHVPIISQCLQWIGRSSLYILCFHLIDLDCSITNRINVINSTTISILLSLFLPIIGTLCFTQLLSFIHKKRAIHPITN